MNMRPSSVPMTEVISTSQGIDMSVAYILMSLRGRLLGPVTGVVETPMSSTETGVHSTRSDVISSMNTLGLGLTRATCVMTSGWSTKELSS